MMNHPTHENGRSPLSAQKHWINGSLADSLIRSLGLVRRGATFFFHIPHHPSHTILPAGTVRMC